jgi:hypothetical protein
LGGTARRVDIMQKILGDVEDVEVNVEHSLRKKQVPFIVFFCKFFYIHKPYSVTTGGCRETQQRARASSLSTV